MLIYKVIQKLKELYPQLEIVLWAHKEAGKLRINDVNILRNINLNLIEKQLENGGEAAEHELLLYFAEYIEKRYVNNRTYHRKKGAGRPPINLTETQIRYAVENTKSNWQAAVFLKVQFNTYKKYADMYGLYDSHKNMGGKGVFRKKMFKEKISLEDIFANKRPSYNGTHLKRRLIQEQIREDKCEICGENKPRLIDGEKPLILDFKDANFKNFALENLRLICYNCAFKVRGKVKMNFKRKLSEQVNDANIPIPEKKDVGDDIFDKFNKK